MAERAALAFHGVAGDDGLRDGCGECAVGLVGVGLAAADALHGFHVAKLLEARGRVELAQARLETPVDGEGRRAHCDADEDG